MALYFGSSLMHSGVNLELKHKEGMMETVQFTSRYLLLASDISPVLSSEIIPINEMHKHCLMVEAW